MSAILPKVGSVVKRRKVLSSDPELITYKVLQGKEKGQVKECHPEVWRRVLTKSFPAGHPRALTQEEVQAKLEKAPQKKRKRTYCMWRGNPFSLSGAARHLGVHPNTLYAELRRLEQETECDRMWILYEILDAHARGVQRFHRKGGKRSTFDFMPQNMRDPLNSDGLDVPGRP